jgi:hypothetical protein
MKITYRDKIIAGVLLAITILLIGGFALCKPTYQKIKTNKESLEKVEQQKKEIEGKIAAIPGIQKDIKETYTNTNEEAKVFVPLDRLMSPTYVDEYMQGFADEAKVKVTNVTLEETSLAPLDYYYDEVKDPLGDLRRSADVNGSLQKAFDSVNAEGASLSQRAKESIVQTKYGVEVTGTRKHIFDYLQKIKEFEKAENIVSVDIADYSFGKDAADQAKVSLPDSPDGEEVKVAAGEGTEISNTSKATLVITLYSVYNMEEPNVD